jgi:glycogen phosphorylase
MPSVDIENQVDMLVAKTKHYLITVMGRVSDEATLDEFYRAFCYALREEIMINWLATTRTQEKFDVRRIYYLSMEYMPGRIITNNINNLNFEEVIRLALHKMNRNYNELIALEPDPGLGNGGLGRLASCFLDSLATKFYPARAYGLRYQYGIFEQQLWDGMQIEAPDSWLLNENPWEFRRDTRKVTVKYGGQSIPANNIHGEEIYTLKDYDEVRAIPFDIPIIGYNQKQKFGVVTLRLWTTKESPKNFRLQKYNAGQLGEAAENTALTDVLYPNDYHEAGKRARLKQEFLLVSSSLQDILRTYLTKHDNFRLFADKVRIQINDTHPSLIVAELIRTLTKNHDIPWKMAVDMTIAITGYTNHTILAEALEQWDHSLLHYLLPRQCKVIERLNYEFCNTLRSRYPNEEEKVRKMSIIENGKVRMANLAIYGSHKINGVAALHTEILKNSVFKDFYELYPDRFINITNGVTQRRWLLLCNPELAKFITKRIGDEWITDFTQIQKIAQFAGDGASQEEFLTIKKKNKIRLIEFLNHENKLRNAAGEFISPPPLLDASSLFDVQVKRIHEYKRQLMNILHVIMLYHEISENPHHERIKRTIIFGGKAASAYETAKDIIRLICCVGRRINKDPAVKGSLKVVYVENYNVSRAEIIIPAADLSEQLSTAGTEASGTGNMKLAINGALTIGTNDGANIEMRQDVTDRWWPFSFGCSAEDIAKMQSERSYNPVDICNNNIKIKRAVDSLRDRSFANNDDEHQSFSDLYHMLMEAYYGGSPDRYFVLKDLESYYNAQKHVEELYKTPEIWAEYALHNIAGMGQFSTDISIKNYCDKIWGIEPCPIDEEIIERIRHEYSILDRCRIF